MKHILVLYKQTKTLQSALKATFDADFEPGKDPDPKKLIGKSSDGYFFKCTAYPEPQKDKRKAALQHFVVNEEQEAVLKTLNKCVKILATSDNDPETAYKWKSDNAKKEFLKVVGKDFLTGTGEPGEAGYIPPKQKLCVLN